MVEAVTAEATCRTCGVHSRVQEERPGPEGRTWTLLGCMHWQLEPGPGELVASLGPDAEVWGRFDRGEAR